MVNNVQQYSCGGLNIEDSRIGTDWTTESSVRIGHSNKSVKSEGVTKWNAVKMHADPHALGRFPANIILVGDKVVQDIDYQGVYSFKPENRKPLMVTKNGTGNSFGVGIKGMRIGHNDTGGVSRFFKRII